MSKDKNYVPVAASPGTKEDPAPFAKTGFTGKLSASQYAVGDLVLNAIIPEDFRYQSADGKQASAEETATRMMAANATMFSVNRSMMDVFNDLLGILKYDPDKKVCTSTKRGMLVVGEPGLGKTEMTRALARIVNADYKKVDIGAMGNTEELISRFTMVIEGSDVDIFQRFEKEMATMPEASQKIIQAAITKEFGLQTMQITKKDEVTGEDKSETVQVPYLRQIPTESGGTRWHFDTDALDKRASDHQNLSQAAKILTDIAKQVNVSLPDGRAVPKKVPGELLQTLIDAKRAYDEGKPRTTIFVLDEFTRRKDMANSMLGFLDILNGDANGKPWSVQVGNETYTFTNQDLRNAGIVVVATGNENEMGGPSNNRSLDGAQESRFVTRRLKPYAQEDFEDAFLRKVALPISTIDMVHKSLNKTLNLNLPIADAATDKEFAQHLKKRLHDYKFAAEATGKAEAAWDTKRELFLDRWGQTQEASKNIGAFMMAWRNFERRKAANGVDKLPDGLKPLGAAVDARVLADQILGAATGDSHMSFDIDIAEALKKDASKYTEKLGTNVGLALLQRIKETYLDSGKTEEYAYLAQLMHGYGLLPAVVENNVEFRAMLNLDDPAGQKAGASTSMGKTLEELLNVERTRTRTENIGEWQEAVVQYLLAQAERRGDKAAADLMREALDNKDLNSIITADALEDAIGVYKDRLKEHYREAMGKDGDALALNPAVVAQLILDVQNKDGKYTLSETVAEAADIRAYSKDKVGEKLFDAIEHHVEKSAEKAPDTRQLMMTMALDKDIAKDVTSHLFTHGFSAWKPSSENAELTRIVENRENDGDLGFTVLRMADEKKDGKFQAAYLYVMRQGDSTLLVGDADIGKLAGMLEKQGITYVQRKPEHEALIQNKVTSMVEEAKKRAYETLAKNLASEGLAKVVDANDISPKIGDLANKWSQEDNSGTPATDTAYEKLEKALQAKPERKQELAAAIVEDRDYLALITQAPLFRIGPVAKDKTDDAVKGSMTLAGIITSDSFKPEIPVAELSMSAELLKSVVDGKEHQKRFFGSVLDGTSQQRGTV